jgi:hypothetical protein
MKNRILSESEVNAVLGEVNEIIKRPKGLADKLRFKPRNEEYFKLHKTIEKYGYNQDDILHIIGGLNYQNYHGTTITDDGRQLHAFIVKLEEDIYIKFEFIIIVGDYPTIMLISFHLNE